nr:winged helix-turn-helix domain-containing protein [Shewanella nanhaiensis]
MDMLRKVIIYTNGAKVCESASLSPNEVNILSELIIYKEGCSREYLLQNCWEGKVVSANSVTVAIANIRTVAKQLGLFDLIRTKRGEGYQLSQPMRLLKSKVAIIDRAKGLIESILFDIKSNRWLFFINLSLTYVIYLLLKIYFEAWVS